tara:strand:+ start:636 stop:893 length:258 start_codon:yes stop_codon:yes gene_type:complete
MYSIKSIYNKGGNMPNIIENNDIPVMALTANISSEDVELVMGLIKLLVDQRQGTAPDSAMKLRDIKQILGDGVTNTQLNHIGGTQ